MTRLGKLWTGAVAYVSLLVGAGLSVAGNLADTYRVRGALVDNVDIALAVGPPLATLLVAELFVSEWPRRLSVQSVRWSATLLVGSLAMIVSWSHINELLIARGQNLLVAILWPLAIDGLAIMAMAKILVTRGQRDTDRTTDTGQDIRPDKTADNIANVLDTQVVQPDTGQDTDSGQAFWTPDVVLPEDWTAKLSDLSSGHVSLRGHLSQDTPLPRRTAHEDKLSELSIAQEAEEFLSRLSSQTPSRPVRVRSRVLSDRQRAVIARYMRLGRLSGLTGEVELRSRLAARYGVHPRTIKRAEGR